MSVRTHPSQWVSAQGQYAGPASRFAAYLTDLVASTVLYWLVLQFVSFVVQIVTGSPVSWHRQDIAVIITYIAWQFLYFGFQWAADGSTWGMALLGVQVVRADGTRLHPWQGWVRSLTFPLGFLTLGLGFLGILVQREHRALYDLIAGTTVVYAWDARAARFRYLARQAEPVADAAHGPGTAKPAAVTADHPAPVDQTTSTAELFGGRVSFRGYCRPPRGVSSEQFHVRRALDRDVRLLMSTCSQPRSPLRPGAVSRLGEAGSHATLVVA
jgi:uncharacterized RDD family membrane protein YckC